MCMSADEVTTGNCSHATVRLSVRLFPFLLHTHTHPQAPPHTHTHPFRACTQPFFVSSSWCDFLRPALALLRAHHVWRCIERHVLCWFVHDERKETLWNMKSCHLFERCVSHLSHQYYMCIGINGLEFIRSCWVSTGYVSFCYDIISCYLSVDKEQFSIWEWNFDVCPQEH